MIGRAHPAKQSALRQLSRHLPEALAVTALMALVSLYSLRQMWDIDVYWHVVAGRLLLEKGLGVSHDTFSAIDPERAWIPLAWGYHVLTCLVDRAWGLRGLWLSHAAMQIVAFGLLYWTCRKRLGFGPLASMTFFSLVVVLYADRFRARPHVFNLLFEIVLLPWLVRGPRSLGRTAYVVTALVFGLWANIHGGGAFVFLCVLSTVPAAALVERVLRVPGREGDLRRAATWFACALVPALLSPLFVRAVVHTFSMVDATYEYTYEWHPSFRLLVVGTIPAHYVAGIFPSLVLGSLAFPIAKLLTPMRTEGFAGLRRALTEYDLGRFMLAFAVAYITHRSLRFIYMSSYALLIEAPLLARAFTGTPLGSRARTAALGVAFAALVALGYQSRVTAPNGSLRETLRIAREDGPVPAGRFPVAQADFLDQTGFEGGVFCQASWGGYLLYRLWPKVHVLVDGRGNHDASVTHDLRTLGNPTNMRDPSNGPTMLAIYDKYPTDVIVHQNPAWPSGYLPPPDHWLPVEADAAGSVWVRPRARGAAYLERLGVLGKQGD